MDIPECEILFFLFELLTCSLSQCQAISIFVIDNLTSPADCPNLLDVAVLLIIVTALPNMGIDTVSQLIRRQLKISPKLVVS